MGRNFDYHSIIGDNNPLLRYHQLLEAAVDEFSAKKFGEASLNDILKKARMSKGSLYHHFGDKFGLYLAMMDILVKKKLSFFHPAMMQKAESGDDFFSSLKEIMKSTMDFMLADERLHHLFNRVMEESDEFRRRLYGFFPFDYTQYFSGYIQQAMVSGQINSRFPPEFVARVIEILFSNIHRLISAGNPEELFDTATRVVDMIRYGIGSR